MAAERKPPSHASMLASPLALLTRLVLKSPQSVIAITIALAAACIVLAVGWMGFRTSRLDLLNPRSAFNQRWLAYLDEFGDQDDVVVVVDAPTEAAVVAALEDLAAAVRQDDAFYSLMHQVDLSPLRAKALHYLSADDLRQVESFAAEFDRIAKNDWSQLTLVRMLADSQSAELPASDPRRIASLASMLDNDAVVPSPVSRLGELAELQAEFEKLSPQWDFISVLRDELPEDGFVVGESTQMAYMARIGMPFYHPRTYVSPGYQGTLGYGFPTALGVKVANPDKEVVSISGDGGFLFVAASSRPRCSTASVR